MPHSLPAAALALATAAVALLGAGGCGGSDTAAVACTVQAPTSCPDPAPRYADVAPVLEARCVSCHTGLPGASWSLRSYEQVADWADVIRAEVASCLMPPPDSRLPMSDDERLAILTWIRCGALE